nr:MAG TPA: hypothetical protein [Caudoviricetes sp.]
MSIEERKKACKLNYMLIKFLCTLLMRKLQYLLHHLLHLKCIYFICKKQLYLLQSLLVESFLTLSKITLANSSFNSY